MKSRRIFYDAANWPTLRKKNNRVKYLYIHGTFIREIIPRS